MAGNRGDSQLTPELVQAVGKLLKTVDAYDELSDKLSIIDRGLKLDALRLKAKDNEEGSAFEEGVE